VWLAIALLLAGFLGQYGEFRRQRRDVFDPTALAALARAEQVDAIIEYAWTVQCSVMFPVLREPEAALESPAEPFPCVATLPRGWELDRLVRLPRSERLLLVSYFKPLSEFQHKGHRLAEALEAHGYTLEPLVTQPSRTPIEVSRRLFNGTNSLFVYLAAREANSVPPAPATWRLVR
jgi:hypothetical protein